ncbi:MAG: YbaB/EbfC family nucleoid-associated protein [Bacteroidia bacterium]|nr:YbaB/EbfC family nucleoid-associated protein [Bacteroidia bacterium]MDW8015231.1 YbaB/EbfC family nucleoid-associated protein [Bacteroidia bacterium]
MWDFVKMLQRMQELSHELERVTVTGFSKDGGVKITLSGHQQVLLVEIDSSLVGKKSELEQAIPEAFHDARDKLQQLILDKLGAPSWLPFLPGNIGLG